MGDDGMFWAATTGAVVSLGIAWHELPRFAAGLADPLDAAALLVPWLPLLERF
jgi:hypothetical protein